MDDFGVDHYFLNEDIMLSKFLIKKYIKLDQLVASQGALNLGESLTSKISVMEWLKRNK